MSGFTVTLKGLDAALSKLDVNKYKQEVQAELDAFGLDVVRDAKLLAPVDEGHLKGSINSSSGNLSISITVGVDYAAYVEFGTRAYAELYIATLPLEWAEFAAQYKGSGGGTFAELVQDIVRWCGVKGIPAKAAYPIALKILRKGIPAQPFLYPAYEKNRLQLEKNLKNLL